MTMITGRKARRFWKAYCRSDCYDLYDLYKRPSTRKKAIYERLTLDRPATAYGDRLVGNCQAFTYMYRCDIYATGQRLLCVVTKDHTYFVDLDNECLIDEDGFPNGDM